MTTRWRPDFDPNHLYFLTTTAAKRAHIFRQDSMKRIVADSLYYASLMNRVVLYAFVIMPNHVHTIVQCPPDVSPADWARAFKAGTSRLIIRHYQVTDNKPALDVLRGFVNRSDRQNYKVWEDGYLAKDVITPAFLDQKLTYVHNNPLQPHWGLAGVPEAYVWSSARLYLSDEPCLIPVRDVRELLG